MNNFSIQTKIDGINVTITPEILARYDIPLPRYTSYPPAPHWKEEIAGADFTAALMRSCANSLSLYVHLPFCRARCGFCACNAFAAKKSDIIGLYIYSLISEMDLFLKYVDRPSSKFRSLHWGGGTPTYLTSRQMEYLQLEILKRLNLEDNAEIGIEADPMQTTVEKIRLARDLGFNRISFGIQDTNMEVLRACGRRQDIKHVRALFNESRKTNFHSINIDLCYGLPCQNHENFNHTLDTVIDLSPDRISLFNFAYIPRTHPNQRKIDPALLPGPMEKIRIFTAAIEKLGAAGYEFIGLDHFAKKNDELFTAKMNGNLKRTFQGYTAKPADALIGVGVTSISQLGNLYAQNDRHLASYLKKIKSGQMAAARGFFLSDDDLIRCWVFNKIFCEQGIDKDEFCKKWNNSFDDYFEDLNFKQFIDDGLILQTNSEFKITPLGRLFIRNIASKFDKYLNSNVTRYSRSV
jgi:oxygen-independent coproporphyrinogen-3 oxidase